MDAPAPFDPDALLAEAATLTMGAMRAVSCMIQIEQNIAKATAAWLPDSAGLPASLAEATASGQAIDDATAAMAQAVPHTSSLTRDLDRLSRSLRRIIALKQRLQAGWPRPAPSTTARPCCAARSPAASPA